MSEQTAGQPPHEYQSFLARLPVDWRCQEIRQLGTVVGGGTPSRDVPSFWNGTIPWVTPGEVSGNAIKFLYDTNDHISAAGLAGSGANLLPTGALMVTTRATLGARAINAVPMTSNQGFKSIVFKRSADASFYFHLFEKVQSELVRRSSGTTFLEISGAEFSGIVVPSPCHDEKRQITEVLDTLDAAIHETEAIIAKLKLFKQGLLHDLLTRGIDANGELRPPHAEAPHLYWESPLGLVPQDWDVKALSEIADVRSGSTPPREMANRYFAAGGIPWVKTLDLNENVVLATDEQITEIALRETPCSLAPAGSVLVAMYGGWEQVGRTALLAVPAATNQAISAVVLKSSNTASEFVLRALQHGRPRWQKVAASTRKDPNITKVDVRAFTVPVPMPEEQREIVRRLKAILDRQEYEASTLSVLRNQKSGLMDDLLTGRVRVTPLLESAA